MNLEYFSKYPPTPRVYYREDAFYGKPLETEVITLAMFEFILHNAGNQLLKNFPDGEPEVRDASPASGEPGQFKYITLSDDGISYDNPEHGHFYLPKAIVFYDVPDSRVPSSFHFLAKIQDQVELCHARGGEECLWHNMPSRITPVTDTATIAKVEATLAALEARIAREMELKAEKKRAERKRGPASPKIKAAYSSLLDVGMPESPRKSSVQGILKSLKDDEPEEIFRHLLGRVNSELIPFFIVIDWKTSIDELHEWVRDALRENFGLTADFLKEAQEDDDLTVSDEAGFSAFDEKLRQFGLQFSLVDTGNDEYVFIIHPQTDLDTVRAAFDTLGLSYQSVSDLYS